MCPGSTEGAARWLTARKSRHNRWILPCHVAMNETTARPAGRSTDARVMGPLAQLSSASRKMLRALRDGPGFGGASDAVDGASEYLDDRTPPGNHSTAVVVRWFLDGDGDLGALGVPGSSRRCRRLVGQIGLGNVVPWGAVTARHHRFVPCEVGSVMLRRGDGPKPVGRCRISVRCCRTPAGCCGLAGPGSGRCRPR